MRRDTNGGLSGCDGRIEHLPQQFPRRRAQEGAHTRESRIGRRFLCETAPVESRYNTDLSSVAISAGLRVTLMPHSSMTASFSLAVPLPPEMMAPA